MGRELPTSSQQATIDSMMMSKCKHHSTTEVSQANIVVGDWAEKWIASHLAVDYMVKIMKGITISTRHELFMDKRERDLCSGSQTSRLHQLSNPSFLGGDGEKDIRVIKYIIDHVFMIYFHESDPRLMKLGSGSAFVYTSSVLFPETFIHYNMVQGKSRTEAEQKFMQIEIDENERKVLHEEIEEAMVKNSGESDEDSENEWVDHSDIEEDNELVEQDNVLDDQEIWNYIGYYDDEHKYRIFG